MISGDKSWSDLSMISEDYYINVYLKIERDMVITPHQNRVDQEFFSDGFKMEVLIDLTL